MEDDPRELESQRAKGVRKLLDRNAEIITVLNELLKLRRGSEPTPLEHRLAREAYHNLAAVTMSFQPKDVMDEDRFLTAYLDRAWELGVVPCPFLGGVPQERKCAGEGDQSPGGRMHVKPVANGGDNMRVEGQSRNTVETIYSTTGVVNSISPLARGPGTAPVVIGGSFDHKV